MKAIIFDMDGVIINSQPLYFQIEKELLEEMGYKINQEVHDSFVGTTDYDMWSILKKEFNLEASIEELIEINKRRLIQNIHKVELVDNFQEFMLPIHAKGYSLALASSNNRRIVDFIIQKFKLDRYLKVTLSGEDVLKGKPDPEIFLKAAEKIGANPSHCLVIEDAATGVTAAKAAGMKCIGLKNSSSGNQDLSHADLIVENFNELTLDTIKKLF